MSGRAWVIFLRKINSGDKFEHRFRLIFHLTVFLYHLLLDCSLDRAGNKKAVVLPCYPIVIMQCTRLQLLNKLINPQVTFFFICRLAFQVSSTLIKRTRGCPQAYPVFEDEAPATFYGKDLSVHTFAKLHSRFKQLHKTVDLDSRLLLLSLKF